MSEYTKYPRGSEWRKWDLHVHTPSSHLSNGFGTDWDEYVKQLFKKAIANNVSAIGITDYFTIDGYKKLRSEYLDNPTKLAELFSKEEVEKIASILILPNIEFRLNKLVGANRINFHVILSNEVPIDDIEENFLHEIDFTYESAPQTEDEKRKLKINNLQQLGSKLIDQHENFKGKPPLFVGMMNAVVDDEQIVKLLVNKRNLFEGKYLLALPSDEDLSVVSWNGQDHQARKLLIQKSDILISANPNTISWALGKKHKDPAAYIEEFKGLKPCIGGSDAHTFDELFTKNESRQVWIKSDLTYKGLKQIIFEPEDRVQIQANIPEGKAGYQVIDHIKINSDIIYNQTLPFNSNLNSIIGGRSSGKSVLLGSIAKKVKSSRPVTLSNEEYQEFVQSISDNITVIWKDGKEENNREIEFFEQGYMHDIARSDSKLNGIIKDILIQKGKEPLLDNYSKFITQNSKSISGLISDYFRFITDIEEKAQKVRDKGDQKGIEDEISKLKGELQSLSVTTISEEDKAKYEQIKSSISTSSHLSQTLTGDIQKIESLKSLSILTESIDYELVSLSDSRKESISKVFNDIKSEAEKNWKEELRRISLESTIERDTLLKEISDLKHDETYVKVQKAFEENEQLSEYEQKIKVQNDKLFEIKNLMNEIDSLRKQSIQTKEKIKDCHKSFFEKINEIIPELSDSKDGLEIKAKWKFDIKKYRNVLQSGLNQQGYTNQGLANYEFEDFEHFEDHQFNIFDKLEQSQLTLKGGYDGQNFSSSLLSGNFFTLNYDLEYEGDDFKKMSDGKKAFVVLKLLLDFNDKKCPILIDQPEDDLDNRAIYNDLVQYLIKKKKERQIIVATHNPNIVVGADSELVICANQHGEKNANSNSKKFQYVAGSLEHTFPKISGKTTLESQGTREHVCDVLEGGDIAFKLREKKYDLD